MDSGMRFRSDNRICGGSGGWRPCATLNTHTHTHHTHITHTYTHHTHAHTTHIHISHTPHTTHTYTHITHTTHTYTHHTRTHTHHTHTTHTHAHTCTTRTPHTHTTHTHTHTLAALCFPLLQQKTASFLAIAKRSLHLLFGVQSEVKSLVLRCSCQKEPAFTLCECTFEGLSLDLGPSSSTPEPWIHLGINGSAQSGYDLCLGGGPLTVRRSCCESGRVHVGCVRVCACVRVLCVCECVCAVCVICVLGPVRWSRS